MAQGQMQTSGSGYNRVVLAESSSDWPDIFRSERDGIALSLGISAESIEHFGSTAIPGLIAKPVIDMMVPVERLRDDGRDRTLESSLGYRGVETDFSRRVLFRRDGRSDRPAFHLHLVIAPSWPLKNELLFRDWLMEHPEAVTRYAGLKRRLAVQHGDDVASYTAGKSAFIRDIVQAARAAKGLPAETDWSE